MISEKATDSAWLEGVPPEEIRRILDALYRLHHLVAVITDFDRLLESIMEESKKIAAAEASSLLLYDESRNDLFFQVALGETGNQQALKQQIRLRLDEGIAGSAATTRKTINVSDAQKDERIYRTADEISQFETRSLLAVPLVDHDKLVGVLEVVNKVGGGPFTDVDERIMEVFASRVAMLLVNAKLIEENIRQQRLAALGMATAGLYHHTKNVISGLSASVELIDMGFEEDKPDLITKGWPILKRGVDRISNIVEDLLAFSKPRKPLKESCRLSSLLEEAAGSMEGLCAQRGIGLELDVGGLNRALRIDPIGINRCVINLLSNAVDAVPTSSGRIWIRCSKSTPGWISFEIADNGPGIPAEKVHEIFDPFFSTKGSKGTGLGLAVSAKIVKEHGGKIDVYANEAVGSGAVFRVSLPNEPPNDVEGD